jgi:hypothetical protein
VNETQRRVMSKKRLRTTALRFQNRWLTEFFVWPKALNILGSGSDVTEAKKVGPQD